ncbi:hypothetical protein FHX96_000954 [Clostridium tetanomorphum]|nr:hypothetical protein [Clostridium tetanomorphum]NRZ96264.1 hypothetical protein [Clostridium tetanomorphum]SQC02547.1 Uncharacterised protein [Clostridium tetanomorphum]
MEKCIINGHEYSKIEKILDEKKVNLLSLDLI